MIYRSSFLKKELRQAYAEYKISLNRKISFALFLGLLSFALYFVLQTLQESVLADVVPEIMQPSYFSTVYLYIHVAFLAFVVYYLIFYETLFFAEIKKNSWYLMIHMGHNPARMFYAKLTALGYNALFVYTLGFIAIILLTTLLKFPLIIAYLPALYLVGVMDLVLITIVAMVFSLFVRASVNARYGIGIGAAGIPLLKVVLGYYEIISNRVTMQNYFSLFDLSLSPYFAVWLVLGLVCMAICYFLAGKLAGYYNVEPDGLLPLGYSLFHLDPRTGEKRSLTQDGEQSGEGKVIHKVITGLVTILLVVALLANMFIIVINASTRGQEVSIRGVIPFIFQSNTMEPEIKKNDLTFFQKVDLQYPLAVGEIVLFKEANTLYIERIVEVQGNSLVVDIDNYPPLSKVGALKKTVLREAIIGVYIGANRWLGALILFANTIIGRIFFLLIPAVLLFYRGDIRKKLKR